MKNLILLFVLAISTVSFGQDRVNRKTINFDLSSGIVKNATGWAYNPVLGEWVDYENVIEKSKDYKTEYKSLKGEYMMSHRDQNFISFQTKTININNDTLFVVLLERYGGRYKYPALQEDWYTFKKNEAFIFKKEEFEKLINLDTITDAIVMKTKYKAVFPMFKEEFSEEEFLKIIQTEIDSEKSEYSATYGMYLQGAKSDGKLVIRFRVPEYIKTYGKPVEFDKEYFELDRDSFLVLKI